MTPSTRTLLLATCCALTACATTPATSGPPVALPARTPMVDVPAVERPRGETAEWWYRSGAAHAARNGAMRGRAKNVIIFLGDGMSLTTVAAARILAGQLHGHSGEEHELSWERFPHTAFSKTYNTDHQTPDSAGTMTAIASGVKTRAGVLGIGPSAPRRDCAAALAAPLTSLLDIAQSARLRTGIVTTTRITHATPAAMYASSPERDWENDSQLPRAAVEQGCRDIARQLIEPRSGRTPDVVFGGGRMHLLRVDQADPERPGLTGLRRDGRDLVAEWQARYPAGAFVWNRTQLEAARGKAPILGLFEYDHLHFEHDRPNDPGEPSLAELTAEAIARLKGPDGFLLLVEGGRIDHAHHYGNAHRALTDTIAMADAVQAAVAATSSDDTLILVTADHSHTLTFAGYPVRGNPILGKAVGSSGEGLASGPWALDATGRPYTTLGYANGPGYTGASANQPQGPKRHLHPGLGYEPGTERPDLSDVDTADPDYLQESIVPLASETHGGDDVGVWASGPGSDAIRGTLEQHVLFHVIVQATPALRTRLCDAATCNADGVPVELPDVTTFTAK